MTEEEKWEFLRRCIAFGSATSPYVLTDAQEFELYDFLDELKTEHNLLEVMDAEANL